MDEQWQLQPRSNAPVTPRNSRTEASRSAIDQGRRTNAEARQGFQKGHGVSSRPCIIALLSQKFREQNEHH